MASYIAIANIDLPCEGKRFNDELNALLLRQNNKKIPILNVKQVIIHPGEVNILKRNHNDARWIATHSDSPNVFIWNVDRHKYVPQSKESIPANSPDLILQGHKDSAPYALDWNKVAEMVASGGKDTKVLLWELDDYQTSLGANYLNNRRELMSIHKEPSNLKVYPKEELRGHSKTVEDLSFCPSDKFKLCSVGDDRKVIVWDTRISTKIASEIETTHNDDLHCVDWNTLDEHQIAIGSNDGFCSIYDIRKMQPFKFFCAQHEEESYLHY
eukprot:TRINITY_DN13890_c0_g1_i1.p1 TRINITY_DN13890_c0_g1~~TRINITY_DN13890_c0_g1_i1.p1  ORF type:complete len:270 (-),score=32.75 TRINITY_DN13890_c0_g1_i1:357-1166(-)